jgi:Rrf2 family protein
MKITAQEEYGLRCLLKVAQEPAGNSLTLNEIAASEGLSVPYAAKMLSVLRQAGYLDSTRGRSGGYRLALPAEQIGLGSLLLKLGEPLFDEPGYCERHAGTAQNLNGCVHQSDCSLRALWQTLEQWMRQSLDPVTLADLLQKNVGVTELLRKRLANLKINDSPLLLTVNLLSPAETRTHA